MKARIADTRFVLNELAALNSGASPDARHRPLPAGLAGTLDLTRVGMFGHSLGGATSAEAMAADRRILAGLDLDGSIIVSGLAGHREAPAPAVAGSGRRNDQDARG